MADTTNANLGIDVKKVSKLANLDLTPDQEEVFSGQPSKIIGYINKLDEAVTDNKEPLYNVSSNKNITREDTVSKSFTQEEATKNSLKKDNGYFVTKGVFEE